MIAFCREITIEHFRTTALATHEERNLCRPLEGMLEHDRARPELDDLVGRDHPMDRISGEDSFSRDWRSNAFIPSFHYCCAERSDWPDGVGKRIDQEDSISLWQLPYEVVGEGVPCAGRWD